MRQGTRGGYQGRPGLRLKRWRVYPPAYPFLRGGGGVEVTGSGRQRTGNPAPRPLWGCLRTASGGAPTGSWLPEVASQPLCQPLVTSFATITTARLHPPLQPPPLTGIPLGQAAR